MTTQVLIFDIFSEKDPQLNVVEKLCQLNLLIFSVIKIHQLTNKSGTNLWSDLSWAKDDPEKGHRLSLQVHDPTLPSNRLWLGEAQETRADKKIRDLI